MESLNPLDMGISLREVSYGCVYDPYIAISNEEAFLQGFLVILKKFCLGTTCICLACSNILPYKSVSPVAKGLIKVLEFR